MLWFKNRKCGGLLKLPYHFDLGNQDMEEPIVEHSTKASRVGEFLQEGKWRITGSFIIIPPVMFDENIGQLVGVPNTCGAVIGKPRGENIGQCYFCHTMINEHIVFTDVKTGRMVNIGNVCVDKLGVQLGNKNVAIAKGLKSLKEKVVREFKKNVHRKDLITFLDEGMGTWQKEINDKVDAELKANEHAFWNPPTRTVTKNGKNFELQATLWEQKDGADKREYSKRNPVKFMRDKFYTNDWNVKPMIPVFEELIKKQGFDVVIPKPRPLTGEELLQLSKEIQVHIDDYLKYSQEKTK